MCMRPGGRKKTLFGGADILVCPNPRVRGILAPPSGFESVREDKNVLHSPIRDRQECLPHRCLSTCPTFAHGPPTRAGCLCHWACCYSPAACFDSKICRCPAAISPPGCTSFR